MISRYVYIYTYSCYIHAISFSQYNTILKKEILKNWGMISEKKLSLYLGQESIIPATIHGCGIGETRPQRLVDVGDCSFFFFGIQIGTNRNLGTFETALNNRKLETLLGIWANGNQGSCVPMSVFLPKVAKTSTTSLKRQEDPKMACGDPGSWTRGTTNRETTKKSRNS